MSYSWRSILYFVACCLVSAEGARISDHQVPAEVSLSDQPSAAGDWQEFIDEDGIKVIQHLVAKRSEKEISPYFERASYSVLESNQTLVGEVCIKPGGNRRFISVFSARGLTESCSLLPCPQATEGEDYVGIFREFFLKPGDEPVCLDITLNNDNLIEGREFFLLALKDLRWGEITTTAVVIINDDDDPTLLRDSYLVLESADTASVCVEGGLESVPVQIQVLGNFSSASADDYEVLDSQEQEVEPGEVACFEVTIVDDDLDENSEQVVFVLTQGNGTNATFSLPGVITIIDDDFSPVLEFRIYNVREDAGFVEVCVVFNGDASNVTSCLSTLNGTAFAPFDFIPVEVKFNISGGERVCHMIGLVNNTVSERTESFTVMLTSSNSVASPNQAIVYITDDDVLDFESSARRFFVVEATEVLEICVGLLSGSSSSITQGLIFTQQMTAIVDDDFRKLNLRFVLNRTLQECFSLRILQDVIGEFDEELVLHLLTFRSGFVINRVTAIVVIRDDDASLCENLVPPTNGRLISLSNGNFPGSIAVYRCNPTFTLVGSVQRECQLDGIWTGTEPTCQGIGAGEIEKPNPFLSSELNP